jgi:hypothetical protein
MVRGSEQEAEQRQQSALPRLPVQTPSMQLLF